MYSNTEVQSILSDSAFEAYRVVGADSSGDWVYTESDGTVTPMAITTGASTTQTAQGQYVTPAILLGGCGAVQVALAASSDVILGTVLVALDDGYVTDVTSALETLDPAAAANNIVGLSLVDRDTTAQETDIIPAMTYVPAGTIVGILSAEES